MEPSFKPNQDRASSGGIIPVSILFYSSAAQEIHGESVLKLLEKYPREKDWFESDYEILFRGKGFFLSVVEYDELTKHTARGFFSEVSLITVKAASLNVSSVDGELGRVGADGFVEGSVPYVVRLTGGDGYSLCDHYFGAGEYVPVVFRVSGCLVSAA